jgi:hypothetical protein
MFLPIKVTRFVDPYKDSKRGLPIVIAYDRIGSEHMFLVG